MASLIEGNLFEDNIDIDMMEQLADNSLEVESVEFEFIDLSKGTFSTIKPKIEYFSKNKNENGSISFQRQRDLTSKN